MAPTQRVVLLLDLKVSRNLDKSVNDAKRKIRGISGVLLDTANVAKRALQFRISTAGINAFFNSLKFARTEAVAFQSALADVIKLDIDGFLGLGSQQAEVLTENISRLSKQFNVNRVAAAKSFQTVVTAGFRGAEATKLFETSLLAQASAGLTSNNAISLLISTIKQFNLEVGQTEQALDVLLAIQSKSAIGFGEFAGAFRTGGAALAASTESLAQAGALIAALAERTRESGSVVGTFFKTAQARITGRRQTREQIESLGVEVEIAGRLRPFVDVLTDLQKELTGVNEARKDEILSIIFGIRQVNRAKNLLTALNDVRRLEEEGAKSAGEARRRAAIESQTLEAAFNKAQIEFVQGVEKEIIGALDSFVVIARAAASAVSFLTNSIAELVLEADGRAIANVQDEAEAAVVSRTVQEVINQFESLPEAIQRQINEAFGQGADSSQRESLRKFLGLGPEVGAFAIELARLEDNIKRSPQLTNVVASELARVRKFFIDTVTDVSDLTARDLNNVSDRTASADITSPGAQDNTPLPDLKPIDEAFKEALDNTGTQIAESQIRIQNAYRQILDPANKFNDSLIQQRRTLTQVGRIQIENQRQALQNAQDELEFQDRNFGPNERRTQEFNQRAQQVLNLELQQQAEVAEFDANAIRRLNVQLNSLKDRSREAGRAVSTQTRRLNELRKEEAQAAEAVAAATSELRQELLLYQVGLLNAQIESRSFVGQIGDLVQRLRAVENIVPTIAREATQAGQNRLAPAFQNRLGAGAGARQVLDLESRLSVLRRDSLRQQLTLVQDILDRQRQVGESFFALDAGGRNQVSQGLGLINQIFGRFGGDIGAFQGLSTEQLNAFGRELIGLPRETKDAILEALRFIPEGGTVAGFTGEQIRNIISTASLGRAPGSGIADIQDLERRAAESTIKLAELNTDGIAASLQQLDVANRQLDEQKAQTETARIQLQVAREQLAATLQGQADQRAQLESQLADFRSLSAGRGGGSFAVDPSLGFASTERIAQFRQSIETSTARTTETQEKNSEAVKENTSKLNETTQAFLEFLKQVPNIARPDGQVNLQPLFDAPESIQTFAAAITDAIAQAGRQGNLGRDINLSVDSDQDVTIKLGDIEQLPAAISRVLEANPTITSFEQFEKIVGPLLVAIVEAGIEEGTFPPVLRSRLPQLTGR